jgi:hypothetical protein
MFDPRRRPRGGIGQTSMTVLTRGGFSCWVPPFPPITDYVEVDVRYGANGSRTDV